MASSRRKLSTSFSKRLRSTNNFSKASGSWATVLFRRWDAEIAARLVSVIHAKAPGPVTAPKAAERNQLQADQTEDLPENGHDRGAMQTIVRSIHEMRGMLEDQKALNTQLLRWFGYYRATEADYFAPDDSMLC